MPSGVEHRQIYSHVWIPAVLIAASMPSGVEHLPKARNVHEFMF